MALPIQYYVNFIVYFADESEYNFAVAALGGSTAAITPADVAAMFGFVEGVNYNTGGALDPDRGMYGFFPFGTGLPTGNSIGFPGPTGETMDGHVLSVQVQSTVTPPLGPGPDGIFTWSCIVQKVGGTVISEDDSAPMPPRRWLSGFEMQASAEGGTSGGANDRSRDSSRTMEGVGYALSSPTNINMTRSLNEYGTPTTGYASWERFYLRLRRLGSANNIAFWRTSGFPSPLSGGVLRFTTAGDVNVLNSNSSGVETLLATISTPFTDLEWHRVDVLIKYNNQAVGGGGSIRVYIDGTIQASATVAAASGGIGTNSSSHSGTIMGTQDTATGWEWDIDDWHNAEIPNILGVESLTSVDWLCGTHIEIVRATTGTQTGWTGPFPVVNQMPTTPAFVGTPQTFASSTSAAQVVALTEYNDVFENRPSGLYLGPVCALFSSWSVVASGTNGGQLAYSIGGIITGTTTTIESSAGRYNTLLYKGSGTDVLPQPFTPVIITYQKAADAIATNLHALGVEVQYVGIWGFEDNPEFNPTLPRTAIYHNCYWPLIAQAFLGPDPGGPVCIKSGTYVGNGTFQTIDAPLPFHFLWIRNVSNPALGVQWYGTNLNGHPAFAGKAASQIFPQVNFDTITGIPSFTVAGTDTNYNSNGVTYQYIMFCDPGMVYAICGAFKHSATITSAVNTLLNPNFTPNCGFFVFDRLDNDAVQRLIYKGPGDGANEAHTVDGTSIASAVSFGTGSITSLSGTHNTNNNQTAYVLFRTGAQCEMVMVQAFSYTGNGAVGTRNITCTPTSGRFPCFVYVQPTNAQGWFKDPSDVGTSSRTSSGGTSATAITAVNVDQITVGTTLNANGIVYNVFIFPGSSSSFANGTFQPGDCSGWIDYPEPEEPPPGVALLPNGGLILSGTVPKTILMDVSGIYTIIPGKRNDTLYDRLSGQPNVDVAIPNPNFKTGYIGG